MRIAFVYDAVDPYETGGVQRRIRELGRRLADNHDVHHYGMHYWDGPAVRRREGVTLHGVCSPSDLYVDGRRSITGPIRFATHLLAPLLRADFDVIDCQAFPYFPAFPSALHRLRGTGVAITWHEVWNRYWMDYLGTMGHAGRLVERAVARLPVTHLAVSEPTAADLAELGPTARIVPNGVDLAEVERIQPADRDVDVLFAGRLTPEKDVASLVRAITRLDDRRLLVVGEGGERRRLERLAARLDAPVVFEDFRSDRAEFLGLMKAARAFVMPSRREGFGMSVLEALACGTPVVTTDHPRNAAIALVEDGLTGAVCPPTPSGLAAGIERVTDCDPADCAAAARPYDWKGIADRLESVYVEVAAG